MAQNQPQILVAAVFFQFTLTLQGATLKPEIVLPGSLLQVAPNSGFFSPSPEVQASGSSLSLSAASSGPRTAHRDKAASRMEL